VASSCCLACREEDAVRPKEVEDLVSAMLDEMVEGKDIEIVDVMFDKEGGHWFLRVYIHCPNGVSMDDCTYINETLGKKLDDLDPIPHSYVLEVSSSGEKPLRKESDYVRFRGRQVLVNTYVPINGMKSLEGKLLGLVDDTIQLEIHGETVHVPTSRVSQARLVVEI
jgi:ribosome maturation factor RimP